MNTQDRIVRESPPDEGFARETIIAGHEPAFDDMVSFVDEADLESNQPAESPTAKHVLWQFPEEALLAGAAHDLPTRKQPFLALLAAALILGGAIVGMWHSIPWSELLTKRPSDNAIATPPHIKPPVEAPSSSPSQLIPSREVLPASYQSPASVASATVASGDAAALVVNPPLMNPPPKPVELAAAPTRQAAAPARTSSIALGASAGRVTEPMSAPPMVSSNSVTRADVPEPPPALEPALAPTPPPSRIPAARVEPEAPTPVVSRSEPDDIQQALDHYRRAYQRLDAGAAQTVWPSVDVRALARAFDTLASQELAFEACLFDVAGEAATAQCRGTSTYTPKIGNHRPRLESRQWTFRLRKDAGGWKIQSAQVRQ